MKKDQKVVLSPKAALLKGMLLSSVRPVLAQDAKVDFTPALKGVTAKNFADSMPAITDAVKQALKGKLAQDADIADVIKVIEACKDVDEPDVANALPLRASDEESGSRKFLAEKLSAEDMKAYDDMCGGEKTARDASESDEDRAKREKEDKEKKDAEAAKDKRAKDSVSKGAMDAALEAHGKKIVADQRAIREAERAVRPYVGEIEIAMDSAVAVYQHALSAMAEDGKISDSIDYAEIGDVTALKAILANAPMSGAKPKAQQHAFDAAGAKGFSERFKNADRIGVV